MFSFKLLSNETDISREFLPNKDFSTDDVPPNY